MNNYLRARSFEVMQQNKKNKSAKWWLIIKLLLTACAIWFIYLKVTGHENSQDYFMQLKTVLNKSESWILFLVVLLLMFLNWTTEALKWKFMINKIEKISTIRALEAVFSGLTISFFTPNRIGEYAGRVFHLHEGKRMQATIITVIENSSQLLVTLVTGSIASIFYMKGYMEISSWMYLLLRFLFLAFGFFCVLLYFNLDVFEKIFLRINHSEYWKHLIHVFSLYSNRELFHVLMLSFVRYIIFSLQFFILLRAYDCYVSVESVLLMTTMVFFVMSVIPTFTITEIGIRGAVSAFFFGKITLDVLPVINAAFSLWLINLAIPAFVGAFFIFHFRLEKNGK